MHVSIFYGLRKKKGRELGGKVDSSNGRTQQLARPYCKKTFSLVKCQSPAAPFNLDGLGVTGCAFKQKTRGVISHNRFKEQQYFTLPRLIVQVGTVLAKLGFDLLLQR